MYLNELPRENITDFFNLAHTLMCSDGKVDEKEKCDKFEDITKRLLKIYEELEEIFEDNKAQERL